MTTDFAVDLENIDVSYDETCVLQSVTCKLEAGKIHMIVGPSGAGKSTLLKVMNGLIQPEKGCMTVLGSCDRKRKCNCDIGYIPQHLGLVKTKTALYNTLLGSLARISMLSSLTSSFPEEEVEFAKELLEEVGLESKQDKRICELSGGEKRRVAIARAFMQRPKLLLADEVLSDLDAGLVKRITKQIKNLSEKFKTTIVMVEHDLHVAKQISDTITIIRDGKKEITVSTKNISQEKLQAIFLDKK